MLNYMGSLATLRCGNRGVGISGFTCDYKPAGNFRSMILSRGRETASIGGIGLNKAISLSGSRARLTLPRCGGDELMDGGAELVGCSHGWVAMFNKRNNDLFLSDPVSDRIIKLPAIETLGDPYLNLDLDGRGSVSKVILSSSPDDYDCRAMMTFGPANRLAFCLPGRRSSEWTPIGDHFFPFDDDYPFERVAKVHEDLVYCTRQRVFTSITAAHLNLRDLRFEQCGTTSPCWPYTIQRCDWDIKDPNSPKLVSTEQLYIKIGDQSGRRTLLWLEENIELLENECIQIPHIVYAEHRDEVFVVLQFVRLMSGEGVPLGFVPTCELKGLNGVFRGHTFGFIVMEMKEDRWRPLTEWDNAQSRRIALVDDLKGMAMFVGINHSFAISADDDFEFEFELKPNSIYFNDSKRIKRVCGINDNGIFDYATKTISHQNGINHSFASSASRLLKPNSAERIARVCERATAAQPH